ncbi:SGNH/GDSL hydrolase family protein [Phyllobacterium myrsinacearum]|jgi:lysophospholipase L1-like esterase|uniref:Endoglucanase n=1 Tax=Phyllobacterium myrsinacearum TaxID=28101 RepID=A0A2S9JH41_9HYPH|nr:SGNH/GDSL hydrolase family protein [Phyllobacterium myrsinacearum]PRD52187.1 hypothetical protein C5750_14830 [Phyllobacterium myrsinacearum]PWV83764.1 lysophospholipase L1-like esterase [Phyllobacterium myrsinacearum]RZV04713.1 lysophospholipase L1-like esterase [Phyllobacterium myrsinacearum]
MSKRTIISIAIACLTLSPVSADTVKGPARWIGRTDIASKRFAWPGSGVELRFIGTRAEITLIDDGNNSVMVELDGQANRLDLANGRKTYVLAENLEQRAHTIRLTRRTEGQLGPTQFVDAITDGTFVGAGTPEKQIVVIGDSISAGYGIEGKSHTCAFSPDTENQYLTYAAIAARSFGAEITTLAASGRGASINADGTLNGTLPQLMDRTMPFDDAPLANAEEAGRPDVIVVHLGTNDFGNKRRPRTFEKDYGYLLTKLRAAHPDAIIYAAIGPMLDQYDFPIARDSIAEIVSARVNSGDKSLRKLVFEPGIGGIGCDWHPDTEANIEMARQLEAAIIRDLGWNIR